jgi:exonuclease 1
MGITGLLPLLRSVTETVEVSSLRGMTVAVDALVWLHKGVYSCAVELAAGEPTDRHLTYCVAQLNLLLHHGVKPVLVFDGGRLPAKAVTEGTRAAERAAATAAVAAARSRGDAAAASAAAARAVDVTPQLAWGFIAIAQAAGLPVIVAPYEADAQLAYLARRGVSACGRLARLRCRGRGAWVGCARHCGRLCALALPSRAVCGGSDPHDAPRPRPRPMCAPARSWWMPC